MIAISLIVYIFVPAYSSSDSGAIDTYEDGSISSEEKLDNEDGPILDEEDQNDDESVLEKGNSNKAGSESSNSKDTVLLGDEIFIQGTINTIAGFVSDEGQINNYCFTANTTGQYRFEISDLDPEVEVDIAVYNISGNKLASTSYGIGNGEGITINNLMAGQQYQVDILQYSKYSDYILLIGAPTTTRDISGLSEFADSIDYRDQIVKYTYTPAITGRYRFEISDLDPSAEVDVAIYNASGNKLSGTSYGVGNGEGITVDDLTAGQQYEVQISYYSKYSKYTLLIGVPTATTDISGLSEFADSIDYRDQIVKYTYTPAITGRCRFEMSDLDPSAEVDVAIYNASGNKLSGTSYGVGNGEGITVDDLAAGQQYEIHVSYYSKYSKYTLLIGVPTATTDISGLSEYADSIDHRDQIVKYTYTPAITGRYRFEISDLDPSAEVDVAIYNASGNKLSGTSYGVGNGEGITVDDLAAGQQYEIHVSYYSKYSKYTLLIGVPTATTDISGLSEYADSIDYRDQIVKYTYTPAITGRYRFEMSDLDPSAEVDVAIYNASGNKLSGTSYGVGNGEGITVDDLTAGQQYEIHVSFYSKYSGFKI